MDHYEAARHRAAMAWIKKLERCLSMMRYAVVENEDVEKIKAVLATKPEILK